MARASLNPDKAKQGGSSIESGAYRVTAAKCQNVKTDYKPCQPCIVMSLLALDKHGKPVSDAEEQEITIGFGETSSRSFSPGHGKSMQDADPEDLGKEVDVEGNTVYCEEGAQFNASSGAVTFLKSLAKHGFPADILDACWFPSFVGLEFILATLPANEVNEQFGTRLNTKPTKDGGAFTYKVASKWLNPSYLGASTTTATAAATTTATTTAATATTAATTTSAAAEPASASVLEEQLYTCVKLLAKKKAGKTLPNRGALDGFLSNEYASAKFPGKSNVPGFKKLLANEELVRDALIAAEATLVLNDDTGEWTGSVTFKT